MVIEFCYHASVDSSVVLSKFVDAQQANPDARCQLMDRLKKKKRRRRRKRKRMEREKVKMLRL